MNCREFHPQILLRAAVLGCLLIVGCAQKMEHEQQLKESAKAPRPAASVLAPPPAPLAEKDCPSAERYRDNICELAKKICGTTDDSAGNVAEGTYCSDARTQCDTARQRYREACQ